MEWIWWGVIILILIIVGVIITIAVLNYGNTIDIVNTLPSYRIYSPTGNVYWGVLNTATNIATPDGALSVLNNKIWAPLVNNSLNADLDVWSFQDVTSTFDDHLLPNQRHVKLINRIYESANIGINIVNNQPTPAAAGYVDIFPPPPIVIPPSNDAHLRFTPSAVEGSGLVFIYTDLGDNFFTLSIPILNEQPQHVNFDSGGPYAAPNNVPAAVFQLLPLPT